MALDRVKSTGVLVGQERVDNNVSLHRPAKMQHTYTHFNLSVNGAEFTKFCSLQEVLTDRFFFQCTSGKFMTWSSENHIFHVGK